MRVLHASTFPDVHLGRVHTSGLEKENVITVNNGEIQSYSSAISALFHSKTQESGKTENMWKEAGVGGYNLSRSRRRLTTGLWTSQKALSWLSRIFLSVLSFFLSILRVRSGSVRKMARGSPGISVRSGSRIRMGG